jgi:hypothetical protein
MGKERYALKCIKAKKTSPKQAEENHPLNRYSYQGFGKIFCKLIAESTRFRPAPKHFGVQHYFFPSYSGLVRCTRQPAPPNAGKT